ncbi:hypothetical protein OY671_009158, partial [Metschnikowia pulcherrima]
MEAIVARDPGRSGGADDVRSTENNVARMIGDGLWGTATGRGDYDSRFADVRTGHAVTFRSGVDPSGAINEVEVSVVRDSDEASKFPNPRFERKPIMEAFVPEAERMSRERLSTIADGYFNTSEQNDGQIFTRFHPDCNRVENGVQTTNNPDFISPIAGLPCEEQFKLGWYRYDDR